MRLILFMILTNFTIGSKVGFDGNLYTIVDIVFIPKWANTIIKPNKWWKLFTFVVICKNKYGSIEIIGINAIKNPYDMKLTATQIMHMYEN